MCEQDPIACPRVCPKSEIPQIDTLAMPTSAHGDPTTRSNQKVDEQRRRENDENRDPSVFPPHLSPEGHASAFEGDRGLVQIVRFVYQDFDPFAAFQNFFLWITRQWRRSVIFLIDSRSQIPTMFETITSLT